MKDLKSLNNRYSMFNDFIPEFDPSSHRFTFSAKDNLVTKDFQSSAGSKILDGYRPAFDSTAVSKMRLAGGKLIGKTNMDEFGFGTFSANSGYGIPKNPFDIERSAGGSSGGAACAASLIDGHVALGVSTGGSISCPASFCGVYGITPTYGRVSRYGLIDYGNSLDKIGILSYRSEDLKEFLPIISGKDERDPTSCVQPNLQVGKKKIASVAVIDEAMDGISKPITEAFNRSLDLMKSMGIDVTRVKMPSLKYATAAYYVIATSEASTNLARYCGMRYGQQDGDLKLHFDNYFSTFRSKYFGTEAKRRIMLGTFTRMVGYRDRYYSKALQVRQLVISEYKKIFEDRDAVVTPTMPFIAPKFTEISEMSALDTYKADFLTIPPNISGMPHLSVPCGYHDGMPIGLQFTSDHWNEDILIDAAIRWDSSFDTKRPEGVI